MKKGYWKLLLNESAASEQGAGWFVTAMDWLMMALVGMRERTVAEWEVILGKAGCRVVRGFYMSWLLRVRSRLRLRRMRIRLGF